MRGALSGSRAAIARGRPGRPRAGGDAHVASQVRNGAFARSGNTGTMESSIPRHSSRWLAGCDADGARGIALHGFLPRPQIPLGRALPPTVSIFPFAFTTLLFALLFSESFTPCNRPCRPVVPLDPGGWKGGPPHMRGRILRQGRRA